MKLTPHFSLREWTESPTAQELGIVNFPNAIQLERICWITLFVLERVRDYYQRLLVITSGFRCPQLNQAVGGMLNSAHLFPSETFLGAVDFQVPGANLRDVFNFVAFDSHLPYDQMILETGKNRDSAADDCIHYAISSEPRLEALTGMTQGQGIYTRIYERLNV